MLFGLLKSTWVYGLHEGSWPLNFYHHCFPKKNLPTSLGSTTDMAKFLLKKHFQVSAFVHACRATKVYWIDSGRLTSLILFTSLAPLSLVCWKPCELIGHTRGVDLSISTIIPSYENLPTSLGSTFDMEIFFLQHHFQVCAFFHVCMYVHVVCL